MSALHVMFLSLLLSNDVGLGIRQDEEGACYSRFDYEFKVVQQLVQLQERQEKLTEMVHAQREVIDGLKAAVEDFKFKMSTLEGRLLHGGEERGTTYIRWGRTSCPRNGTELVYAGYAGGSHYTHSGAASSYLCLPSDPLWGKYDDTANGYGLIYGAEYQIYNNLLTGIKEHDDVPCAVCRSTHQDVLMIPGRNACYDNWTLEYHGYLMSGAHGQTAASDYVCLDEKAEVVIGGGADHNGKLFYTVEGRCGSLKCPPYVNGRELTCVVCSK